MNCNSKMRMLTVSDLADYLAISRRQVWRLLSSGKLPSPVRIGGSVRWPVDVVVRWTEAGCPPSEGLTSKENAKDD